LEIFLGHDIGSGGLITTLLEMCFADNNLGAKIDFSVFEEKDIIKYLCREYRNCISKRRCCTGKQANANNVAFLKWELLLPKRLRPWP
jgi:phosphoribosylformylglycinamidine synthase